MDKTFDYIDSVVYKIANKLNEDNIIDSYDSLVKLGQGGFGVAYRAGNKTIKITVDKDEYDVAKDLLTLKHKNVYNILYAKKFNIHKKGKVDIVYVMVYDYLDNLPKKLMDLVMSFTMKDAHYRGQKSANDYLKGEWSLSNVKSKINNCLINGFNLVNDIREFDPLLFITLENFFGRDFELKNILNSRNLIYIDQLNEADKFCENVLNIIPDWHPLNVMYNKEADQLILIDLGTDV